MKFDSRAVAGSIRSQLNRKIQSALLATRPEMIKQAKIASSETESLAKLAAADHPYARRHGVIQRAPDLINSQSGALRNPWRIDAAAKRGTAQIMNTAFYAAYVEFGTRVMFARHGITKRVQVASVPKFYDNLSQKLQ